MEIVILGVKFRRHQQRFLSIVKVSDRCRAQTFERGPVGVSCFTRRIFPEVAHFEFACAQPRELIVGKHTEIFKRDRTRPNRDNRAHGIRVCARVSKAEDHSPRISDHNKLLGVQLLTERLDVFNVCVQINRRRIIRWQLRSTRSALLPHDASVFLAQLIGDALHRMNVFAGTAA